MRRLSLVLIALFATTSVVRADNLVTTRPVGTDSVNWSQLNSINYQIPTIPGNIHQFLLTTTDGVSGAGDYCCGPGFFGVAGQEVLQWVGGGTGRWQGNFAPNDSLLWTWNSGPLTLTFSQGFTQIGAQIQPDSVIPTGLAGFGPFTAQICDVNGCFTEAGNSTSNGDNSAIYIGIDSPTPITWVTFSLTSVSSPGLLDDFAINQVTLDNSAPPPSTVTPEPGSFLLFGSGLLGLIGATRRKFVRAA